MVLACNFTIKFAKSWAPEWEDIEDPIQVASNSKPFPQRWAASRCSEKRFDGVKNIGNSFIGKSKSTTVDIHVKSNYFQLLPKLLFILFPWTTDLIPKHEEASLRTRP